MTVAQKANVARFKAVQAEAKKLKAKNKNLTHLQAVKQAWAIMLHKKPAAKKKVSGLDKVIKSGNKTTVLYTKHPVKKAAKKTKRKVLSAYEQAELFSPGNPYNRYLKKSSVNGIKKKPTEKAILKKVHSAKTTSKTLFNKLDKLDEAQHAHMSGINRAAVEKISKINEDIARRERILKYFIEHKNKFIANYSKAIYLKNVKDSKAYIAELKKHKTELKKFL